MVEPAIKLAQPFDEFFIKINYWEKMCCGLMLKTEQLPDLFFHFEG